jgi:hypothetical protein
MDVFEFSEHRKRYLFPVLPVYKEKFILCDEGIRRLRTYSNCTHPGRKLIFLTTSFFFLFCDCNSFLF